jgi:hypothetical protein
MIPVTARFLAALRQSHTVSVAATIRPPSDPGTPIEVPVIGGQITIDRDARVRRQGSLEVAFSLSDGVTRDIVRELPFGGYAVVERGIRYADGDTERVPLGMFRVESVVWSELEGKATLTLADRMAQIQDEPFVTPYTPGGLKPSNAAVQAVQQVFGSTIAYHVLTDPASEPTLADVVYDEDRAQAITDLASNVSAEALFDYLGDFVIRPRNRPADTPVWTVDAGEGGVLLGSSETLDRSSVRNGVAVRGQPAADQPPIYSLAVNDDPDSPTRWGGPFGKVALISSSTSVTTQAQADSTAASLLNLRLGLARTVTLNSVPNPAVMPDDLIEIVFSDGRTETQSINAVQLALDVGGALQITTTSQLRTAGAAAAGANLTPERFRMFAGDTAWRELESATLVTA